MACSASREAEAGRVSASRAGGHAPRTGERVARKSASRACFSVTERLFALGASCFSCQTSAISAGRQRLSEGHHALPGPPDGAGLLPMDPAEVPDQSEWR